MILSARFMVRRMTIIDEVLAGEEVHTALEASSISNARINPGQPWSLDT